MHYYKFNIGDYKSHTEHLELLEDLAFRRMLDWLYLHEKPLPKNVDEIARMIRMRTHNDCIEYVLQNYFKRIADGWINERVSRELGSYQEKSEKAKKSAEVRWKKNNNENNDLDDANALQTDSERNAKHKTLNNKQYIHNSNTSIENVIKNYNEIIERINPNWSKCASITPKRKSMIKSALQLVKPRAEKVDENPDDYLLRLLEAMARDNNFFSGNPNNKNKDGFRCAFETNFSQTRIVQAIDWVAGN